MDITGVVLERLNKRVSSVPFPVPDVEKPAMPPSEPAPKGKK